MLSFACGGSNLQSIPDWKDMGGGTYTSKDSQQHTTNGILVYGKVGVSDEYLSKLDESFDQLKSEIDGLSISERIQIPNIHQVFTTPFRCEPSPASGTLSWRLRADVYDGSEFDYAYSVKYDPPKQVERTNWDGSTWLQTLYSEPDGIGGIYAAEQVLNIGTPSSIPAIPQVYLCQNDDNVKLKYRFGLEHIWLLNSEDGGVIDYGQNTLAHWLRGHPLIPMNPSLVDGRRADKISSFVVTAKSGDELVLEDTLIKKEKGVTSVTVLTK